MRRLIESLQGSLPQESIRLNTPVTRLTCEKSPADSKTAKWRLNDAAEIYDKVIVATPPKPAARLIAEHAPAAAEALNEIESASTAIVVVAVRREEIERPVETFGMVVPPIEKRNVLAVSFASQKFAGRAPDDHVLIRVFIGRGLATGTVGENGCRTDRACLRGIGRPDWLPRNSGA